MSKEYPTREGYNFSLRGADLADLNVSLISVKDKKSVLIEYMDGRVVQYFYNKVVSEK